MREQSSTAWWNKIGSHYIFWILKADFLKEYFRAKCYFERHHKNLFSNERGGGKGSFPFEMTDIPRNCTSLQKFPMTANSIVLASSQVAGCIACPELLSDGDFAGEWASLMPSHYLRPVITKLKWLNTKCMLNSMDKVKELSWTMTLQFS